MTPPTPSPSKSAWFALFAALLLSVPVALWLAGIDAQNFIFSTWSDRDLHRALRMDVTPQVMGPEITGIGRSPGGTYYVVLGMILRLSHDPVLVHLASVGLTVAGILTLAFAAFRHLGRLEGAAVLTLSLAVVTQIVAHTFNLWNPAFVFVFIATSHALFLRMLATGQSRTMPWMAFVTALGAQVHISLYTLLVLELVAAAIWVPNIRRRTWAFTFVMVLASLGPYLRSELASDFQNLGLMTLNHTPAHHAPIVASAVIGWLSAAFGFDWLVFAFDGVGTGYRAASVLATSFLFVVTVGHFVPRLIARLRARVGGVRDAGPLSGRTRVECGLAFVALVGLVVQRVGAIYEDIMMRHYLILAPAGVVLSACALAATIERLEGSASPLRRVGGQLGLAVWLVASFAFNFRSESIIVGQLYPFWGLVPYRELQTIRAVARDRFHLAGDSVATGTVVLRAVPPAASDPVRPPGSPAGSDAVRATYRPVDSALHLAWPTFEHPSDDGTTPRARCLVVVTHDPRVSASPAGAKDPTVEEPDLEIAHAIAALGLPWRTPPRISAIERHGRHTYATFDAFDGNCPRSLHHPYNPSVREERIARSRRAILEHDAWRVMDDTYGIRLGELPHAAIAGVQLTNRNGEIRATLHGEALRGNGGTQSHALVAPRVVFTALASGLRTELSIFGGTVGGAMAVTAPPWHSPTVRLAPGTYSVRFLAHYEATYRYGASESTPVDRILDTHFAVR